jgi:hypothetical protein
MPRAVDKFLINQNTTEGSHAAIQKEYASLRTLGEEIETSGWGNEAENLAFRDEMIPLCAAHNAADNTYLAGMQALRDKMAAFIDNHKP